MSPLGRTVRLFLVDGSAKGVVTAEIMNWSGHAISAPLERLPEVLRRPEARRTGVYILFGEPLDASGRRQMYVGETDDVGKRLIQHSRSDDKDYFEHFCIFTSKDQNLTKAHVRYLENRLTEIARKAGRAIVENKTEPTAGALPESDVSDMEFFTAQIEIVLPVLGYDILRPLASSKLRQEGSATPTAPSFKPGPEGSEERTFASEALALRLKNTHKGMVAEAAMLDGEVVVLAGSTADANPDFAMNQYSGLRDQLIEEGALAPSSDTRFLQFTRDVTFNSPSAAAAVIYGRNSNGRTSWRLRDGGQTLKEYQIAQTEAVE